MTRECSKKILVSLNNSDSAGAHVGSIVSRLSARDEEEKCGAMLLEEGVGGYWGYSLELPGRELVQVHPSKPGPGGPSSPKVPWQREGRRMQLLFLG